VIASMCSTYNIRPYFTYDMFVILTPNQVVAVRSVKRVTYLDTDRYRVDAGVSIIRSALGISVIRSFYARMRTC
jgi:hypothetical protein